MMTFDFDRPDPTPTPATVVEDMLERTVELHRILVLEKSGIRDGDGWWHGSDPIQGTIEALDRLHRDLAALEGRP